MKIFEITKKRAGQSAKSVLDIYANDLEDAKKQFKEKMTSDLYYDEEKDIYTDECGNEVWGFFNNEMGFNEDVYTWELKELIEVI